MENKKEIIKIINLYKSFKNKEVLRGINLTVYEGESLVIIGGSGAGKSVLIKNIIGLLKPEKGSIIINGVDVTKISKKKWVEIRKNFGMLFQNAALFDSMTVFENVAFPLFEHTKLSKSEIEKIVKEKLALVGLKGIEKLYPSELSGGQRKRVGLARALALNPKIILYDEPTTGLDPIVGESINKLIIKLRDNLNVTSITITHDMKSAYEIANRIAMIYEGKIIEVGTPEEIKNTKNEIVRNFISKAFILT